MRRRVFRNAFAISEKRYVFFQIFVVFVKVYLHIVNSSYTFVALPVIITSCRAKRLFRVFRDHFTVIGDPNRNNPLSIAATAVAHAPVAAGVSFAASALPDAHFYRVVVDHLGKFRVHSFGNNGSNSKREVRIFRSQCRPTSSTNVTACGLPLKRTLFCIPCRRR